ncbi:MAG: NAD(P)/FAD-dependent oxidoreductase [Moraxellaceae bacterium]|nr:NAD(P)/FAD-dependent oxidoreductase [Moraxellaceae bacterium]
MHIAIVGYGTAGQAAAIALGALPGVAVSVFEQAPALGPVGAGFLLQPTGLLALQRLGLLEQALQHGARIDALQGFSHRGRQVMDMRYARWSPAAFGLGMQRNTLFALLHARLPPSVRLHTGHAMQSLDAQRGVLVDRAGIEHGPFDLVVVADGSRSPLRSQHFGDACAPLYPWGAWWCLVDAEDWAYPAHLQQRYRLARNMAGLLPVGKATTDGAAHKLCLYWSVPAGATPDGRDSHGVCEALSGLWPEAAALIRRQAPVPLTHASYRGVHLRRWHKDRAVWIGDAAHGMSPQLGQGVNLALLDALALADALRDQRDLHAALGRFERQRKAHVRWYRWGSHWLTPLFQSDHDWLARMRDLLFMPASRMPGSAAVSLRLLTGVLGWQGLDAGKQAADAMAARASSEP